MTRWLVRRILIAIATTIVAVALLIVLVHLLPGDPIDTILGEGVHDPATVAAARARWGFDQNVLTATHNFIRELLHGGLGESFSQQRPVSEAIRERIGATFLLGGLTLLVNFTVGLMLGVWSALHPESMRARFVGVVTLVGYALPSFVIGMMLVWTFSIKLGWLPPTGSSDFLIASDAPTSVVFRDRLQHLLLPWLAMVLATIAVPIRQQRTAALRTASQPWVLAARARGVSPWLVAWRHCWRPALTPIVTLLGLWLPMLVTGAVFVEVVFNWPGMGSLMAQATAARDLPLVVGGGLVIIAVIQAGSLAADVLYHVVDPTHRQ